MALIQIDCFWNRRLRATVLRKRRTELFSTLSKKEKKKEKKRDKEFARIPDGDEEAFSREDG